MATHCPVCKTSAFERVMLDGALEAERCTLCQGVWITSANYFAYLDSRRDVDAPLKTGHVHVEPAAADSPSLKLCPVCGKFMHYYPIGHGITFGIDKCNTCGGVWLNQSEWETLQTQHLHRKVHAISSDTWQDAVRRQMRLASDRAALVRRLGAADVAELDRITAWIEQHPHRDVLISHLQQHLREHLQGGA